MGVEEKSVANKRNQRIHTLLFVLMLTFGAEQLAKYVPSIPVMVLLGVVFFPLIDRLLPANGGVGGAISGNYLGLKFPLFPLFVCVALGAAGTFMIANQVQNISVNYGWIFAGGCFLEFAFEELKAWPKLREMRASNE